MKKINGKEIAGDISKELKEISLPDVFLALFTIGSDDVTKSFVKRKESAAKELGVELKVYQLDHDIDEHDAFDQIKKVTHSKKCGGAIIQLPVPPRLNARLLAEAIPPQKDIDVLSAYSVGRFYLDQEFILPPSVEVLKRILRAQNIKLSSLKKVAVVGQGFLVGHPITTYLLRKVPCVIALDKGSDLGIIKGADLVVSGTGVPHLIKSSMLKNSAGIIDFGYGIDENGKLCGDFDAREIDKNNVAFYTPTPGGTGPILVASLFYNFYLLNEL